MKTIELHQTIHQEIEQLSDGQLNQSQTKSTIDPLADFIGQADHGNLAKNIDENLYEPKIIN